MCIHVCVGVVNGVGDGVKRNVASFTPILKFWVLKVPCELKILKRVACDFFFKNSSYTLQAHAVTILLNILVAIFFPPFTIVAALVLTIVGVVIVVAIKVEVVIAVAIVVEVIKSLGSACVEK